MSSEVARASAKKPASSTGYKCKANADFRNWTCRKSKPSKSCLTYEAFRGRCRHLTVSRK